MLHRMLVGAGYVVQDAADGKAGLAAYRQQPSDLVMTDIVMPDMEGLEVIRELRRYDAGVKIIAMSGGGIGRANTYLDVGAEIRGRLGAGQTVYARRGPGGCRGGHRQSSQGRCPVSCRSSLTGPPWMRAPGQRSGAVSGCPGVKSVRTTRRTSSRESGLCQTRAQSARRSVTVAASSACSPVITATGMS
jgi:response regulator receiver domain-containing protein